MRGSSIRRKTAYTSKNDLKEKENTQLRQSEERKKADTVYRRNESSARTIKGLRGGIFSGTFAAEAD